LTPGSKTSPPKAVPWAEDLDAARSTAKLVVAGPIAEGPIAEA
jgi:hypothetical protein